MRTFEGELREFLDDLNMTKAVPFGAPAHDEREPTEAHRERFQQILDSQQRFNNGVLLAAIGMVGLVFLVGVGIVVLHRNDLKMLSVAFGGNLFSLLVTVAWIRRLWVEKGLLDLARLATEELTPKEAIKLASVIYWRLLKRR